ncbi:MAG: hypothetical protein RBT51_11785 [Ectothiorhodospiraceae bacterium]|nr:hypothetical protein [Ectothiorhodospiraceae bacterium]
MTSNKKPPQVLARNLIQEAICDASKAGALLENPAAYFRQGGIEIPVNQDGEFNSFFYQGNPVLARHLSLRVKAGKISPEVQEHMLSLALPSFACCSCSVAAYAVSLAIVAVGVAGLANLTPEAAAVVALAEFVGVPAGAALAFISSIGAAITGGPAYVTKEICQWTGAC